MFEDLIFAGPEDENEMAPMFTVADEDEDAINKEEISETLPLLALKNTVMFPGVVIPITVGRDKSTKAVRRANKVGKMIAVISQKEVNTEDPTVDDLYKIGTVARILKILQMPDGSTTVILQGRSRFELLSFVQEEPFIVAKIRSIKDVLPKKNMEFNATISSLKDMAAKIIKLSPQIPSESVMMLQNINNKGFLLNFIASNLNLAVAKKQELLEQDSAIDKAQEILGSVDKELQMLELKSQIEGKVRGDIERQQRDYFLNQQLKTIQEELGNSPQEEDLEKLALRAKDKKWTPEIAKAFEKDLARAKRMNPQVAEYSVTLNYLELMLDLPWDEFTEDNFDLKKVKKVLDSDHHGLNDVKERIIEHLAVLKLKGDMKAPIICLVGPPGVGKTSLGKSIATALGRKFIRMSLGGLHDESEVRGHRKTYIGAMPGRIIQSIKKAKSSNPVFILDEIDKIGKDHRGDPSSALLEVLDPEQNTTFHDNYLEHDYDLSKVLFIATANSLSTIQPALLDRMEIIQLSGYSTEEKVEIAKKHLVAKQRKEHGLKASNVKISNPVLTKIIREYTRESGVRGLDRQIASVMRNIAKKVAMEETYDISVKPEQLKDMLGPSKFSNDKLAKINTPGVAVGLAWTRVGGDVLFIEASLSKGKGKLTLTGNLGDVMKESATTAYSFMKSRAEQFGIDEKLIAESDVHIHVPEGATPKDGPSAGITMLSALVSAFKGKQIKSLAMTGEITLRGTVLPVGGIKEKILAAKRAGLSTVMMCAENQKHVEEVPAQYLQGMKFIYVERMEDVIKNAIG